jgi:hypothetical protein
MSTKVELVEFSPTIGEPHRLELGVFKSFQPGCFGHFRVEASAAKVPVSLLDGTVVDDVVAGRDLATTVATDLAAGRECDCIHVQ